MGKNNETIRIDDPEWVKRNVEVRHPRVVAGENKGRTYKAYRYKGCLYWTLEDIRDGIPAIERSGMEGFSREKYIYTPPVKLGKTVKKPQKQEKPSAGGLAAAGEQVPFGRDIPLEEPPRPVCEVSADYGIRKSPYAGYRVYGQSDGSSRESEPAENSCLLVVHGVTESGKFRLTQGLELEYRGSQKLGNVDKIAFIPSHIDDVRERGWFDDRDCTRIESRRIGKCVEGDSVYAGVYLITLAGYDISKIAFCGNLFDSISVDLRRSRNLNFRRDVYANGLKGAYICVSPVIDKESDRVKKRASWKKDLESKGQEVYLNAEIEASGYETVERYDELRGFLWKLPDDTEWHGVESENIVESMYDAYEKYGGVEKGMDFKLI